MRAPAETLQGIRDSVDAFVNGIVSAYKSIMEVDIIKFGKKGIQQNSRFETKFPTIASVPFSGSITGEFFLCVDRRNWMPYLSTLSGVDVSSPEMEELSYSTFKEIINTAAGTAIGTIKNTFGTVTMLSPRLIEGRLLYPSTMIFNIHLSDALNKAEIEARLSFDMMEQEINVAHEKLKEDSRLDETGLFNKKYFAKVMMEAEEKYRNGPPLTVIFIDINRLKYVNDNFGHEAGDAYIRASCDILKRSCRMSDYCFRIGGDELVALLPKCSLEDSRIVKARIDKIAAEVHITAKDKNGVEHKLPVNLSVGIASNSEGIPIGNVVTLADQRMEEAKKDWYDKMNISRRK